MVLLFQQLSCFAFFFNSDIYEYLIPKSFYLATYCDIFVLDYIFIRTCIANEIFK